MQKRHMAWAAVAAYNAVLGLVAGAVVPTVAAAAALIATVVASKQRGGWDLVAPATILMAGVITGVFLPAMASSIWGGWFWAITGFVTALVVTTPYIMGPEKY